MPRTDNPGTMERVFDQGRWTAVFRPTGIGRFVTAGFLGVWLCGWAVGESFALGTLLGIVGAAWAPDLVRSLGVPLAQVQPGGAGWAIGGFMLVWLVFWTLGGILAAMTLLTCLWGEERVAWDGAGVERGWRVGPFRLRRSWPAGAIERLSTRGRDGALLLHDVKGAHTLLTLGTRPDRETLRDELRRTLGVAPPAAWTAALPAGWESESAATGVSLFRDRAMRRRQAQGAWYTTLGLALAAIAMNAGALVFGRLDGPQAVSLGVLAVLVTIVALWAAWLSHGGSEIRVLERGLELRRWYLGRRWSEVLSPAWLKVERSRDDDGDEWFTLVARTQEKRRVLERRMNEPEPVVMLARWIAERGGSQLDLDPGVEARERDAG